MKSIQKTRFIVLGTLLFLCVTLFAAACDQEPVTPAEKTYYTVTLTYDETQGSAALSPAAEDGKYEADSAVSVTVTPNEDYEVDAVKANGSVIPYEDGKYTFTVMADTAVSVLFKERTDNKVSVTAVYEASEGAVTFDPVPEDGKVLKGTEITATVEPAYGYEIVSVTRNGEDVTSELEELLLLPDRPDLSNMRDHSPKRELNLGAVTEDAEIAVTFSQATHKVTLNVEGPGTCELTDVTEEESALKSLSAVPAATKIHAKVSCVSTEYIDVEFHVTNGETDLKMSIVSGNTYFWVVDKDLTVTVTFTVNLEKAPQNKITVSGGENGSYELAAKGGMPLEDGVFYGEGEATITLIPDVPADDAADETAADTYIIGSLKIKNTENNYIAEDVTADLEDGSYTFPVTGDVELEVEFKKFEEVTPDTAYNGSWQCVVKGETTSTTNIAVVTRSKTIRITGTGITTITGTSYTATLGYTVYVSDIIEERYTIYLVPGLNDAILALSIGTSTTYFIKTSPAPTLSDVTIDERFLGTDGEGSTWYGGAASMPIVFEFGKLKIDSVDARFLAESKMDESIVYTVYANGSLYQLIYTVEDDSIVLHPYGKSTEDDVPYERETPPDPVLVPEHAGTYSDNAHTVVIDEAGNFSFDGTTRKLYYDAQMKVYTFKTDKREYTVVFQITGNMQVFNAAASEDWALRKIEAGTAQYTLTVNCPEGQGSVAYSVQNAEMKYYDGSTVTITITASKHYEVETITVNSEDKTFTNNSGVVTITVTITSDTTVDITFKELKEENLLSDLYIGTYSNSSITVTITASGVTVKWSSGSGSFTDAQITLTGTKTFTLENTSSKRKFTIKINDDGSITLGDPNWAIGGTSYKLTKQA